MKKPTVKKTKNDDAIIPKCDDAIIPKCEFKVGDTVALIAQSHSFSTRHILKCTVANITKRYIEISSTKDRRYRMNLRGTDTYPRSHTWSNISQFIAPWHELHTSEIKTNKARKYIKTEVREERLTDEEILAVRALLLQMRTKKE